MIAIALINRIPYHAPTQGRIGRVRGFEGFAPTERSCRRHGELRDFLRPRTRHAQHVPGDRRLLLHLRRAAAALAILVPR